MARIAPRPPSPRARIAGRIRASYRRHWFTRALGGGRGICESPHVRVTENGRGFCWSHRPDLAVEALASPGGGQFKAARRGIFIQKAYPDRKTCERILRLAGRTKAPPKPPRPRRRPRDRRYVR